ncbi:MAG: hypothetical protein AVDCRST_MAG87-288 [uncultured Thermomicrobiales bacterium]|uniref:Lipoprotein n=1 Tax=uncultured Thermomicrobiales bacterium TaxID=1645740 RepID=A0A6J4UB38_9BACT|nr:MAG: hypothetical protein AVDCRST_MAG87-288 [uncultured Thermomicrobiales bacterium]
MQARASRRRTLALGGAAGATALLPFGARSTTAVAQESTPAAAPAEGLLPENRILLYYGFPENENMGILGEMDPDALLERLNAQADEYRAADPSRPVKVGFELIASVAQASPQEDGSYIADTDKKWLDMYTEYTREKEILLFFDVQMGMRSPREDYSGLEPWLKEPHVHLAIDPEFAMRPGEVPGVNYGQITGADITEAQNFLVELAQANGIPPKVLIVHQFRLDMIEDKESVAPVPGVQLVIDEDGFGTPKEKAETYEVMIAQDPIEFHGIKLFYQQDVPLMTPAEVLAFEPTPDLIIYQ